MGEVNVYYVLVITHSILLCLVTSVDSTNNSNATGVVSCVDREGRHVANGDSFAPDEDPCKTCYCVEGLAQLCTLVQCSPPSCPKWEPVLNQCCKFRCLDWPHFGDGSKSSRDGFDGPSFHLRLALSGTTSLLIIALLIFMVHRLRQRRLLIVMRPYDIVWCILYYQIILIGLLICPFLHPACSKTKRCTKRKKALRTFPRAGVNGGLPIFRSENQADGHTICISEEQRCIGQDDSPCVADDLAGFDFLAYKEPPPPYSLPHQTLDARFDPPPYDSMQAASSGTVPDDGQHHAEVVEAGNYNDGVSLSPVLSDDAVASGGSATVNLSRV